MGKINAFLNVSVNITFRFNLTYKYRIFLENKEHQSAILNLGLKAQVFISTGGAVPLDFLRDCISVFSVTPS